MIDKTLSINRVAKNVIVDCGEDFKDNSYELNEMLFERYGKLIEIYPHLKLGKGLNDPKKQTKDKRVISHLIIGIRTLDTLLFYNELVKDSNRGKSYFSAMDCHIMLDYINGSSVVGDTQICLPSPGKPIKSLLNRVVLANVVAKLDWDSLEYGEKFVAYLEGMRKNDNV